MQKPSRRVCSPFLSSIYIVLFIHSFTLHAQGISSMSITPSNPTTSDSITITVNGYIGNSAVGWEDSIDHIDVQINDSLITIILRFKWFADVGNPVVEYFSCKAPPLLLNAGHYNVRCESYIKAELQNYIDSSISVEGLTAIEHYGQSTKENQNFRFIYGNTIVYAKYDQLKPGDILVDMYNHKGRKVKTLTDSYWNNGKNVIAWDISDLPCSSYFLHFKSGERSIVKKIILIR